MNIPMALCTTFVTMFNLHLEKLGHQKKLLLLEQFTKVWNTLDNLMAEQQAMGLVVPKQKDFVIPDIEDNLCNKGILGQIDPDTLRCTIFYFIGSRFGLCGGKEHCSLVRYLQSQITIEQKADGSDYFVYREFVSKTSQGGCLLTQQERQSFICLLFRVQALMFCSNLLP